MAISTQPTRNSPASPLIVCLPQAGRRVPATCTLFVGGFGSCHPAGTNFLFGDVAVRFINRAINQGVYQQLANRADGKLHTSGPTREP